MKTILGGIIILFILFSFLTKENNIQSLQAKESILAFGDSLTHGYNAPKDKSYPNILSHLSGYKVINAGINGETSTDGLKRLPKLLEDKNIGLMILFFGGNDILQGASMEVLKENLKTCIRMAKKEDIDVLLISVPNLTLFGFSALDIYEEISREENTLLLDNMFANILEDPSLKSDQIHPNALGYKVMAEKIYKKLQEEGWL